MSKLDDGELCFKLFMRALKDAPADKVSVHVEGTEVGFCGDVLATQVRKIQQERNEARIEAETLIRVIDDIQENGAVYDTQGLMDILPWAKQDDRPVEKPKIEKY